MSENDKHITEVINAMALSHISYFNVSAIYDLYQRAGSATVVMENRNNIRDIVPDASDFIVNALRDVDEVIQRAEAEYKWDEANKITPLVLNDPRYPQRLAGCHDAPVVLYYRGSADLNKQKVISIIGTRHCTLYGQDIIRRFVSDLRQYSDDILIVSGLAYGVDINAHREALHNGYPTVGVLAHGLDQIYPNVHRNTAIEMLGNGGLLTEYMSMTPGSKGNFVQRNRIVAGMCDACVLVESAVKGGGLITMNIAQDYGRDCFAFPGPVNAEYSKGCNNIVRDNKASLITSAEDMCKAMKWISDVAVKDARQKGIERSFFVELTDDESRVANVLKEQNDQQINVLSVKSGLPINKLSALLFQMEMRGIIKTLSGGCYHLI